MNSHNININNGNGCIKLDSRSKYEVFDNETDDFFDELMYVKEIPKSGFSQYDFLVRNGKKYTESSDAEHIEVIFKSNVKKVFCNKNRISLKLDDFVVVNTEEGLDLGRVIDYGNKSELKVKCYHCIENSHIYEILRKAEMDDLKQFDKKFSDEFEVVKSSKDLIERYGLEMKVTEAHWQFDRQRLTIYFTAPQRIDFRELVRDLARNFKSRIELRQISSREEAKRLGAFVGPCGRDLCCTSFLNYFGHVTLDHARIQQLSNNVSKLSGNCGRLKCCINFEYDSYSKVFEKYPPPGSIIETDEAILKVAKVDIFNEIATLYNDATSSYQTMNFEEIQKYINAGKVQKPNYQHSYKDRKSVV